LKLIICICGATATGKSLLSYKLAQYLKCPIISADSRTLYRELTIGTAKPPTHMLNTIPHYFIDILNIGETYSAGAFMHDARKIITDIFRSGDFVIVSGGTGFYIHALLFGLDDIPTPPDDFRTHIRQMVANKGMDWALTIIKEKDPKTYERIDRGNPHRIMRILEVILYTGKPFSEFTTDMGVPNKFPFPHIMFAIQCPKSVLRERITNRLIEMIQNGLIDEVKRVYPYRDRHPLPTFVYREFFQYIEGKITLEEAIRMAAQSTLKYAKRQNTWLRQYKNIIWIPLSNTDHMLNFIISFLKGINEERWQQLSRFQEE